ncbi:parE toxin protein [alpha proteobacterium U9-1i]|nr:parE toxin protein [alpha proteobacterium U9-1i]
MKRIRLTPRALQDLDDIADYSLVAWGERQTAQYLADFEKRFQWLAENALLGRSRDEVAPGYRSIRQGSHLIFYVTEGETVVVIGVPHMSRDIEAYFSE